MARVIERTHDTTWAGEIVNLAGRIVLGERCNAGAVASGNLELTLPTMAAVLDFLDRDSAVVAISHDGTELEAYLIVTDDRGGKLGGGQGRWVGLDASLVPAAQRAGVYRSMLEVAVTEYGWIWGRVSNEQVRTFLDKGIAEGAIAPEDPEIITYKRP